MKHCLVLLVLLVLLLPSAQAAGSDELKVYTSPEFAFNGDNVTVRLVGVPLASVFVTVYGTDFVTRIADGYVRLDVNGTASWSWSVAPDAPAGEYLISAASSGKVRNASISILWSELAYQTWLNKQQQIQIDRLVDNQQAMVRAMSDMDKRQDLFDTLAFGCVLVVVVGSAFYMATHRRWITWQLTMKEGTRGMKRFLRVPRFPHHGDHSRYIDGVGAITERSIEAREPPEAKEEYVLLHTKGDRILKTDEKMGVTSIASVPEGLEALRKDIDQGMPPRLALRFGKRWKRKRPVDTSYVAESEEEAPEAPEKAVEEPAAVATAPASPEAPAVAPAPSPAPAPVAEAPKPEPKKRAPARARQRPQRVKEVKQ
jgi:hypothetical protein